MKFLFILDFAPAPFLPFYSEQCMQPGNFLRYFLRVPCTYRPPIQARCPNRARVLDWEVAVAPARPDFLGWAWPCREK